VPESWAAAIALLIGEAARVATRQRDTYARLSAAQVALRHHSVHDRHPEVIDARGVEQELSRAKDGAFPPRWPTTRQPRITAAASIDERARVERDERARWIREMTSLIDEADLPLAGRARSLEDPALAYRRCGRGRRAFTLWARVREWRKLRDLAPADARVPLASIAFGSSRLSRGPSCGAMRADMLPFVFGCGGFRGSSG
jgi:hypothetical protein